ncbi:MAG: type I restriction-modification system subunit M [Candidatus Bathyarchaeota archaeon]|nr:type I restriction-modification system subunit M [Candidatus Bathyarchaeota archaeon]
MANFQEKVTFIWDLADLLRHVYKRNEYQKVILPFTVLKRFDCVLADTKSDVLQAYNKYKDEFENLEHLLTTTSKHPFYNYSKYDFKTLLEDPEHIEQNLIHYLDSFSKNVQDIFDDSGFKIRGHIAQLSKNDLLYLLVKKFSETKVDLHPDVVSNQEMGLIFEELVRKFSEQSNEEAGDHFTPREVVDLMTHLMFEPHKDEFTSENLVKTVYDPACGTGGMLTGAKNYILSLNKSVDVALFGQELLDEIYAICKADMLMKGENSDNIKGPKSTLSKDQFPTMKFDYIISNPPYGKKWEMDEQPVLKETERGFEGRFGAGTPRINDGQLLFLQHMISKMKINGEKSRIAAITNGSPLFTGDVGSGESNIRRWIIENDWLEAIIALPSQLFYNTGINTYIWILTNQKSVERTGKIQLIDATSFFKRMRRNLGNKRNEVGEDDINRIISLYTDFIDGKNSKILDNQEFGYTRVVVERPMRLNYCISEERLENLYSIQTFSKLAESNSKSAQQKLEEETSGKEHQKAIIAALRKIGTNTYKTWGLFEEKVKAVLKEFDLNSHLITAIIIALSEHDDTAEYVLVKGKRQPDSNLRDQEKVPLKQSIEAYFEKEVKPYYPDAWMDTARNEIGYEINFAKYFYKYNAPRALDEIDKEIKQIIADIQEHLNEEF